MPKITFIRANGSQQVLEGAVGQSVMHLAIAPGIPEIKVDCGGACACATCHVVVDAARADRLPPQGVMEADMIEFAADLTPTSRLSCQLTNTDAFDGLVLQGHHGILQPFDKEEVQMAPDLGYLNQTA